MARQNDSCGSFLKITDDITPSVSPLLSMGSLPPSEPSAVRLTKAEAPHDLRSLGEILEQPRVSGRCRTSLSSLDITPAGDHLPEMDITEALSRRDDNLLSLGLGFETPLITAGNSFFEFDEEEEEEKEKDGGSTSTCDSTSYASSALLATHIVNLVTVNDNARNSMGFAYENDGSLFGTYIPKERGGPRIISRDSRILGPDDINLEA